MNVLSRIAAALAVVVSSAAAGAEKWGSCSTALADHTLLRGWQLAMIDDDVPAQFWGEALQALKPIEVRLDRGNIAVVTERSNARESGIYYVLLGSQYVPTNSNGRFFNCGTAGAQLEFVFTR